MDISDPTSLKVVGYYPLPSYGSDIFVKNKIVFATCQLDGIYIIQFDEPSIIRTENQEPNDFILCQNYPNPFNPNTNIKFSIPQTSFITLEVFNSIGEKVGVLVSEELSSGIYSYNWNATGLASGIYFYQLRAGDFIQTEKMVLLK